jgi:hypothetical protein
MCETLAGHPSILGQVSVPLARRYVMVQRPQAVVIM